MYRAFAPLLLALLACPVCLHAQPTYDHCMVLNAQHGVRLHWSLDAGAGRLAVGMQATQLRGYVAMGISQAGHMDGGALYPFADGWVAATTGGGTPVLRDVWMPDEEEPRIDGSDDLRDGLVSVTDDGIFAHFTRALDTGDRRDTAIPTDVPVPVIWAGHPVDGEEEDDGEVELAEHNHRGVEYSGSANVHFGRPSACDGGLSGGAGYTSGDGTFRAQWQLTADGTAYDFVVEADTGGYVSVGFSPDGRMAGADIITASVSDATGAVTALDTWSPDYNMPVEDAVSDVAHVSGVQADGITSVAFRRAIDTGRAQDIAAVGSLFLVWAYHDVDIFGGVYAEHTFFGAESVDVAARAGVNTNVRGVDGVAPPPPSPSPSPRPDAGTPVTQGEYVSADARVEASWAVDLAADTATFSVRAHTTGWVSLGWSNLPFMTRSDCVVWWVDDATGAVTLLDTYSPDLLQPRLDTALGGSDDVQLVSGSQADGWTHVEFRRPIGAAHAATDHPLMHADGSPVFLLWAVGAADGRGSGATATYDQHTHDGVASVVIASDGSGTGGDTGTGTGDNGGGGSGSGPGSGTGGGDGATTGSMLSIDAAVGVFERSDGAFRVWWGVDEAAGTLDMVMEGTTLGYVSVGFSGEPWMAGSDCVVAWVDDATGQAHAIDTWSPDELQPRLDTARGGADDVFDVVGQQVDGVTRVSFRRALDTGDGQDYAMARGKRMFLLYASAPGDSYGGVYGKHNVEGGSEVDLFAGTASAEVSYARGVTPGVVVLGVVLGAVAAAGLARRCARAPAASPPSPSARAETHKVPAATARVSAASSVCVPASAPATASASAPRLPPQAPASAPSCSARVAGVCFQRLPWSSLAVAHASMLLALVGVNAAAVLYVATDTMDFGERLGDVAAANAVLLCLPVARNSVLLWLVGVSFEHALFVHRCLGRMLAAACVWHGLYYVLPWAQDASVGIGYALRTPSNVYGVAAAGCAVLLAASSVAWLRRRHYNAFLVVHAAFVPFFVLASLHVPTFRPYAWAAVAVYGADRLTRTVMGGCPVPATATVLPGDIVRLRFRAAALPRALGQYRGVGQYVFLQVPALGCIGGWHPFTLTDAPPPTAAAAPADAGTHTDFDTEVHVAALGDYTRRLVAAVPRDGSRRLTVRVDGPYGKLSFDHTACSTVVLVAGGIGVTPAIGLLRHVFLSPARRDAAALAHVRLVWSVKHAAAAAAFADVLHAAWEASVAQPDLPRLTMAVHVTREGVAALPALLARHGGEGRPDVAAAVTQAVASDQAQPTGVLVCGPSAMVKAAWGAVQAARRAGVAVEFHKEVFAF